MCMSRRSRGRGGVPDLVPTWVHTGWGTGRAIPGTGRAIPGTGSTTQLPGEQSHTSEAGPGSPAGAGVGGCGAAGALRTVGWTAPETTLRARSVHPWWPSLSQDLGLPTYGQRSEIRPQITES